MGASSTNIMKLHVKKLADDAFVPARAHADDAGLDLYSYESFVLAPGERRTVKTAIALAIPSGYVGLIWDKSSVPCQDPIPQCKLTFHRNRNRH